MQREIKFRGKSGYGNYMVYGSLIKKRFNVFANYMIEDEKGLGTDVITESIGQFTGLKDKNGLDIYEGDIIKKRIHKEHDYSGFGIYEIVYIAPIYQLKVVEYSDSLKSLFGVGKLFNNEHCDIWRRDLEHIEIIGNIHQKNN